MGGAHEHYRGYICDQGQEYTQENDNITIKAALERYIFLGLYRIPIKCEWNNDKELAKSCERWSPLRPLIVNHTRQPAHENFRKISLFNILYL